MKNLEGMIGCVGEDNISSYQGLIIGLTKYLYGCNRYHLQPINLQEDGNIGSLVTLDVQRVKLVKKCGIKTTVIKPKIELGSLVKDILSGAEGVATGVTIYMYGEAPYYAVEPKKCKENGEPSECLYFHEPRLEIIKEDKPEVERGSSLPGGPRNQGMPHHSKL